jgi:hypothetical protein
MLKQSSKAHRVARMGFGITLVLAGILSPAFSTDPAVADESDACVPSAPNTNCVLYTAIGSDQAFTVPAGVTSLTARLAGSGGALSVPRAENTGGAGGLTVGTIAVASRQSLVITVGNKAGYGGGGTGGSGSRGAGGTGGGLSAIWTGASLSSDPYLVAGGGGGAAGAGGPNPSGGTGGGATGGIGSATQTASIAGGGTQTAGGAGGNGVANDGLKYQGGPGGAGVDGGGGGGGGWFGGGGGHPQPSTGGSNSDTGGGGGSGFIGTTGVTDATMTNGGGAVANTSGTVVLEWVAPAPTITFPAPSGITGGAPTITGTAVAGNTVTVTEGGATICTAVADVGGIWSCDPTTPLATGASGTNHTIVATQTDDPANPLQRYPASASVTFEVLPPTTFAQPSVPLVALGAGGTTSLQLTVGIFTKYVITAPAGVAISGFSGCSGGADYLLEIAPDGSTATCSYTPTIGIGVSSAALETLTFAVAANADKSASLAGSIEVTGDNGTRSFPFYVNTPPVIPVLTGPSDGSVVNTSTPPITGTGGEGDVITVTDENGDPICAATVVGGIWSCTPTTALVDGPHSFTPTAETPDGTVTRGIPISIMIDTSVPIDPAAPGDPGVPVLAYSGTDSLPLLGSGFSALLIGAALMIVATVRRRRRPQ